ncbi:MAG TPA: sialidase family protein, partial [Spirochaetia bacterium]|nr:sialidase family protein [Spirochaetia bacterium]
MGKHRVELYVSTIKGAFIIKGDASRRTWSIGKPHFLGCEANHLVRDPRDRKTLLLAARTGHLGPTVFRSNDNGRTWREAKQPPAFPKASEGKDGAVINRTFYLAPGHPSQPGVWWAGTVPHALFRSDDGGATWKHQAEFTKYVSSLKEQKPANIGETPGGAITHSILIDPRNAEHMYVSLSTGGFFE